MARIGAIQTINTAPNGDTRPDSITTDGYSTFVAYNNTTTGAGTGGSSQIVQYDPSGAVLATYDVTGSVDGLKLNPNNGLLYALQNQDGNSTLTLIDPASGLQSTPIAYGTTSTASGYDDIVFDGANTYLSYTNPASPSDPVILQLANGNTPFGPLQTTPVLLAGATGYDTVTRAANQAIPLSDPDSMKLATNGDLILTSGSDATIIDVHNPGKSNQYASFTTVTDVNGNKATAIDDVIRPGAKAGTFMLTDTTSNTVQTFTANHLSPNFYYASVASLGGFGQVNPHTGVFTLLVPASGAHGITFQPNTGSGTFVYAAQASGSSTVASVAQAISPHAANLAAALHDGSASATSTPTAVSATAQSMALASADLQGHHFKMHV